MQISGKKLLPNLHLHPHRAVRGHAQRCDQDAVVVVEGPVDREDGVGEFADIALGLDASIGVEAHTARTSGEVMAGLLA